MDLVTTRAGNIQLQARLANSGWVVLAARFLHLLAVPDVMRALKLTEDHAETPEQQEHAQQFFRLVLTGACIDAWVLSAHSELAPDHWYGVLDESEALAAQSHVRIRDHCHDVRNAKTLSMDATFAGRKVLSQYKVES